LRLERGSRDVLRPDLRAALRAVADLDFGSELVVLGRGLLRSVSSRAAVARARVDCLRDEDVEGSRLVRALCDELTASFLGLLSGLEGLEQLRTVVSSLDYEMCWHRRTLTVRCHRTSGLRVANSLQPRPSVRRKSACGPGRQRDPHVGATRVEVRGMRSSAVGTSDRADDRETESCSAALACVVGPREALEGDR